MDLLAKPVNEHKNIIILVVVFGDTEDELHGNGLSILCQYWQRV